MERVVPAFFVFLLLLAGTQSAAEALYNFGTMQEGEGAQVEPGQTAVFNLYFFMDEEYGNRITHVSVGAESVPEGWEVSFDPPRKEVLVNVSGVIAASSENLYVEPRPVLPEKPAQGEEGIYYLKSPSGKGYLQAKRVQVSLKVPQSAELGKTYTVRVGAEAFWFGSAGNLAFRQSRPFSYSVTVASGEYSEKVLNEEEAAAFAQNRSGAEGSRGTPAAGEPGLGQYAPYAAALLAVAALAYFAYRRRRPAWPGSQAGSGIPQA